MEFLPTWPPAPNALFFFGFLLFCGAIGGYMAHRWPWLPSITGFMCVGFVAGPNVLHLVSHEGLAHSRVIVDVALGLILYRLGLSLNLNQLIRDHSLLLISLAESALTCLVVLFALGLVDIRGMQAAVISAIAISSSPAVLIHVAHELGARGPVTERAKSLVALNNVWAFLAFAALLPWMYLRIDATLATTLGAPLYQLVGSALLGGIVGVALHHAARRTKRATQYQLALVVGAVALTLGLAFMLKLSALFAPLVLGIVVRTIERKDLVANLAFGPAFELFFIALFVYAGASLHIDEMIKFAPAAGVFVLARCLAKWMGTGVTSSLLGSTPRQATTTGLLLIPMAGLAIGLVNTTSLLFPADGQIVSAVVLAAVAILETIGPPIASRALRLSGDTMGETGPPNVRASNNE